MQSPPESPSKEISVGDMSHETYTFFLKRELDYMADANYFDKYQKHLSWSMRTILLDWMMEVSAEFSMKRETFHYSCNFTDRYLSKVHHINKGDLQLVGVTALYIASKMEVSGLMVIG